MNKCFWCGGEHTMVTTPYPFDYVHCPYDPNGNYLPGMKGYTPLMERNEYGVWVYVDPREHKAKFHEYSL